MIAVLGIVIGAALGTLRARSRGGSRLDLLQWAAVGGILGGLAGLFVMIAAARLAA